MNIRQSAVRSLLFAVALPFSAFSASAADVVNGEVALAAFQQPLHDHGAFIVRDVGGKSVCVDASPTESMRINARRAVPLTVFGENKNRLSTNAGAGLDIVLRGTTQLDANPQAKAAFERAAAIWESRIANPMTVYVDVDFGPTRFGEEWEENVIASASSDYRGGSENLVALVRGLLVARGDNAAETSLYGALPGTSLPTDLGPTTRLASPSMLLRGIGALSANAASADPAPSIGFNNAFSYDFDPSNGISAGAKDFEGVVVHEIGHMLGFVSRVGSMELGSEINAPSILDMFRFRPGVSSGTFASANRIQSSGGQHVYFGGGSTLAFSTGRPDGTGGDEQQSSHWKDDAQSGTRIGIMDPTLSSGERSELTANDLQAFGMMGYNIVSGNAGCSEAEPNETAASASTLGLPGSCSGNAAFADASSISINYNDGTTDKIEDVFKLTLGTSAKIKVTLNFTTGDLDVFLFSVSGSTVTVLGNSSGSTTTETFTSTNTLAPGTYYVGVSAFTGSSAYTVSTELVGVAAPPAAPTNLQASGTSTSVIRLTWNDNSNNETEFRIEQKVNGSFVDIGAAAANATAINVTNFQPSTSATFRVKARGASGDSAYSNEATGTTQGQPGVCTPNANTVCLLSNRFRVKIDYVNPFSNPPNQPGTFLAARLDPAATNPDVALFGFDAAKAVEVVVRIVDARPFAPRFDVYYGGLTDVQYTVTITDTQTGKTKQYFNAVGQVGGGVDRSTFPTN
jgi:hypothetical protein